jgi:ribonuclease T2
MRHIVIAALALLPSPLLAQARSCAIPGTIDLPRPDLPNDKQPTRVVPIGGYTLAISWSPEYCRTHQGDARSFQCAGRKFGFVLHGLWPDGAGKDWPQYCAPTAIVPERTIRGMMCTTPSPQLIQHEWAKHGTCMPGETPTSYFARSKAMFGKLRFPDMDRLSRRRLTVASFQRAFAGANPGLSPTMFVVTTKKQGWLDEIWLCHDKALRAARCPSHQGGAALSAPLRIWRGGRSAPGGSK